MDRVRDLRNGGDHRGHPVNRQATDRPRTWHDLRREWPVLSTYQRFEAGVALILTVVIGAVILVALYRLVVSVIETLVLKSLNPLDHAVFQQVFGEMFETGESPAAIVQKKGLAQVSDTGAIEKFCEEVIAANPGSVADFKNGKAAALNFLKGQVMKLSKGKANPNLVGEILERKLKG